MIVGQQSIVITMITRTHPACPSQWEAMTSAGQMISLRYRWGTLKLCVGTDLTTAIESNAIWQWSGGDAIDGWMSDELLMERLPEWIVFEADAFDAAEFMTDLDMEDMRLEASNTSTTIMDRGEIVQLPNSPGLYELRVKKNGKR
jgi:hypothetical protein